MKIVIATSNQHKFSEIREILKDVPAQLLSLKDFPSIGPIEETGSTFLENARLKARTVFERTGLLTLADDSGLEVPCLDNAPGIFSARYSGEDKNYAANNTKLLRELDGVPPQQRAAQFRCVVSILGENIDKHVEGIVKGRIAGQLKGSGGFGYDPLFVPDGFDKTYAELGEEVKNKISHRAKAFQKADQIVTQYLRHGG
jgi:XTP/dITP diphosphohydrolase